jgi:uncharacterized protein (TIGR03435 family)
VEDILLRGVIGKLRITCGYFVAAFALTVCGCSGWAQGTSDPNGGQAGGQARIGVGQTGSLGVHPASDVVAEPIGFDVISFKPAKVAGSPKLDSPPDSDYIAYHGVPMSRLIYFAYISNGFFHMSGEPGWVDTDLWDFQAKVADGDVATWRKMNVDERRYMMRALLTQVLHLKVHEDMTPRPIYALVVAKGGPKLTEYKDGDSVKGPDGKPMEGRLTAVIDGQLVFQKNSMWNLVATLSTANQLGRVIVDRTGLTEEYNFRMPIPSEFYPPTTENANESMSIFDAIKKVGLELKATKGPDGGLVVDHIDRPPVD